MLRVIQEFSPIWVVGENVRGFTNWNEGMVFEQVQTDLEAIGYEVQSFILPAVAVNAPHRRDRVWIVGYSKSRASNTVGKICERQSANSSRSNIPHTDSASDRWKRTGQTAKDEKGYATRSEQTGELARGFERPHIATANSKSKRGKCRKSGKSGKSSQLQEKLFGWDNSREWDKNWVDVATELCRVDDGLPVELDGLKLSKSKHRAERLKGLGNAIVPQVAMQIFNSIKIYEENTKKNC